VCGVPIELNLCHLVRQTGEEATPAQLLVQDLSFVVKPHQHLMITGSNGVGKTAIARVLAGLWAPRNATTASVHTPVSVVDDNGDGEDIKNGCVFVVPQRAYMVSGSLLDQVIYPHTYEMFVKAGKRVEELEVILDKVFLRYLPEREGGWMTKKEWKDVLSGGEKQRVSGVYFACLLCLLEICIDVFFCGLCR